MDDVPQPTVVEVVHVVLPRPQVHVRIILEVPFGLDGWCSGSHKGSRRQFTSGVAPRKLVDGGHSISRVGETETPSAEDEARRLVP